MKERKRMDVGKRMSPLWIPCSDLEFLLANKFTTKNLRISTATEYCFEKKHLDSEFKIMTLFKGFFIY